MNSRNYFKVCFFLCVIFAFANFTLFAGEYHVSKNGNDDNPGTAERPFQTISKASKVAIAGDTITIHSGTYREWVDPAYGGTSHLNRVVYRAAEGEEVIIKGSEISNIFIKTPAPPYDIFENARRPKRAEGTMNFGLGMYDNYPERLTEPNFEVAELSQAKLPVKAENNLYLNGAIPYRNGENNIVKKNTNINIRIEEKEDGVFMNINHAEDIPKTEGEIVNTFSFGEAIVPGVIFDNPDGSPILINSDYYNKNREKTRNYTGPFADYILNNNSIKLWPK